MQYYAHSGQSKLGIPPQTYEEHVSNVHERVRSGMEKISGFPQILRKASVLAALFHDMGKLEPKTQDILSMEDASDEKLLNHVDAGVAWCIREHEKNNDDAFIYAAWLVHAHHRGLKNKQDLMSEELSGFNVKVVVKEAFRDSKYNHSMESRVRDHVDSDLDRMFSIQRSIFGVKIDEAMGMTYKNRHCDPCDLRMALSLLVDADHTDTSINYGMKETDTYGLRAAERLCSLRLYVQGLRSSAKSKLPKDVVEMRNRLFDACDTVDISDNTFFNVPAATGLGKTVSLMCLALRIAEAKQKERVMYIVPFTNIIDQSVQKYRESLVLDGEDPREIVNEIHSKVEYESYLERKYSQLWQAPINASTSVQFFESLMTCKGGKSRKLKQFANSVVIFDEYHTAMPHYMWKVVLLTLKDMCKHYNIDIIFGSGTHVLYWDMFESGIDVVNVVEDDLFDKFREYEQNRVSFLSIGEMANDLHFYAKFRQVAETPDGQLSKNAFVILNTVANAAYMAKYFRENTEWKTFHMSSCLSPADREVILDEIKKEMAEGTKVLLVATSVMECGIDMSFEVGFREEGSMLSDIQAAGRLNRNKEYPAPGILYSFRFNGTWLSDTNNPFSKNPGLRDSIQARFGIPIDNDGCTSVVQNEIGNKMAMANNLLDHESRFAYVDMDEAFKVIDSPAVNVIVDPNVIQDIQEYKFVPSYTISRSSVPIYPNKVGIGQQFHGYVRCMSDGSIYSGQKVQNDMLYWSGPYDPSFYGIYAMEMSPVFLVV